MKARSPHRLVRATAASLALISCPRRASFQGQVYRVSRSPANCGLPGGLQTGRLRVGSNADHVEPGSRPGSSQGGATGSVPKTGSCAFGGGGSTALRCRSIS